jgi:hypothetical protein
MCAHDYVPYIVFKCYKDKILNVAAIKVAKYNVIDFLSWHIE